MSRTRGRPAGEYGCARTDGRGPPEREAEGRAEQLGLFENGELRVSVFSGAEEKELGDVAAILTPSLLGLLERRRAGLQSAYERSPYADEVTFNEFFIWWYHFFYSATTDWLAHKGLLEIPRSGNTTYLIAD